MKIFKQLLAITIVVVMMLSLSSLHIFAATTTQDGLEVTLTTDKAEYGKDEQITATLTVQNTNDTDLTNVSLENLIPEGYKLADESQAKKQVGTLKSGDSVSLSVTYVADVDKTEETSALSDNKNENESKPNNSKNEDSDSGKDNESGNVNNDKTPVQTGDSFSAIVLLIVLMIGSATLVVVSVRKRKGKQLLSLILCVTLIGGTTSVALLNVNAAENENSTLAESQISLEEAVNVGDKVINLKSIVYYSLPDNTYDYDEKFYNDDKTFTKGEWVSLIADKFEMNIGEFPDGYDYFYGDSIDSEYGPVVETVYNYGLLPAPDSAGYIDPEQDVPMFEADKLATREFVAYTVAKAMGFEGEYKLEAADVDSLKYVNEVAVIVNQKFMSLIGNEFKPNSAVSGNDVNMILNRIDYFNDSLKVEKGQEKDTVNYQDNVITLNAEYKASESEDGTYTVELASNADVNNLTTGSVIVLPASDDYIGGLAVKVKETKSVDGKTVLICEEPKIEEVVKDFDFAGKGSALIDKAETSEGVEVEYDPNGVVSGDEDVNAFDVGGSVSAGSLTYTLREKELKPGLKVSGELEVSIPDITAKAKGKILGGFSLDELTFTVTDKTTISGNLSYDLGVPEGSYDVQTGKPKFGVGKTELGTVPFALGSSGFTINLVFFVNVDVSGKISVSYSINRTTGMQYKNNAFRNIKEYSSELTAIEANATARLGVGMAVRLTLLSVFDIVGVDIHGGVGLTIKFVAHIDCDPKLFCGDGSIYLYLTLEMDSDTIVGTILTDMLKLDLSWDIFDEDNSPLKLGIHIENFKLVDSCTYGKGSLLGVVKDKTTGNKIGGAQVKIYNKTTGKLVKSGYTRTKDTPITSANTVLKGEYFVQNLSAGSYQLEVLATGYKKAVVDVDVVSGQRVVCEATLMIERNNLDGLGTVSGTLTNALTGSSIQDVKYEVRKGLNTETGNVIKSGTASGSYSIELDPGYYSILFSKEGFVKELANVTVSADDNTLKNIAMAPTSDITIDDSSFRVVLTWGQYPTDLDSHMYYVSDDGSGFHTWYSDKNHYENGNLVANLDLDDITSYGPETSTVYQVQENGVYSFYVHDYSNKYSDSSKEMSNSGAQVKLYSGSYLVATFNIPENREGTLWHVFDYDSKNNTFDYVNEFSFAERG